MDFDFSEEQRLLKESVDRFIADRYDFEQRKTFAKGDTGYSPENWKQFADLGLLAIPFAEEHGGFGGGPIETMIVMEAFGRGLVLEPYFATVVLGGGVLRHGASEAQKSELIPKIAAGELRLAFAHSERQSRYDLADVATRAKKNGSGYVLDGEKSLVLHGDSADMLIVSARISGEQRERKRHRPVPRRRECEGRFTPRLSDTGWAARRGDLALRRRSRAPIASSAKTRCRSSSALPTRRSPRSRRKPSARWRRCTRSPSIISRHASNSASRSARFRRCNIVPSTCSSRLNRRAAWRCSQR